MNPNGEILGKGESLKEDLVVADIDLDEIFRYQLKDNRLKNLRSEYRRSDKVNYIKVDYQIKEKTVNIEQKIVLDKPDIENTYNALVLGLRDYITKMDLKGSDRS